MPFDFTCQRCGAIVRIPKHQLATRRYCSRACRYAAPAVEIQDDGTALVPLTGGGHVVIDAEDVHRVSGFRWYLTGNGRVSYAYTSKLGFMHQAITECPSGTEVDHIDGDTMLNRRSNLRCATRQQNSLNRGSQKNNKSGYKGVSWAGSYNRWLAFIKKDGRSRYIGSFLTPEDAARAYDSAARILFGEYARLNFPD